MKKVVLRRISFGSFTKLLFLSGVGLGAFLGVLGFIISLFGGRVTANIGNTEYAGVLAGVLSLVISPITFSVCFLVFSIFLYPSFALILKVFKGIKIKAAIEVADSLDKDSEQP